MSAVSQLQVLGLNHQTAPIAVRERLAFAVEEIPQAITQLNTLTGIEAAAILSTCNRTELYVAGEHNDGLLPWLAQSRRLATEDITPYLYHHSDHQAVRHIFRVAAGLDSMVLGETQILGQLKDAVSTAQTFNGLNSTLNHLFQRAFASAKAVRTETKVGANSVSMAAAAVRLAERLFANLTGLNVLFIGAGEMITLCATHFANQKPARLSVANRTLARGEELAAQFNGDAFMLAELPSRLAHYDIVVTSTASTLPIIGLGVVESAIKLRKHRPMFMVDLAVPRDIEPEVSQLGDVYLYTVDDLAEIVQQGQTQRAAAAMDAEEIITDHADAFMRWLNNRTLVPTIRALGDHVEHLRHHELERALKMLAKGMAPEMVLESLSHGLRNKFLHAPLTALNKTHGHAQDDLIEAVWQLHHLHPKE